jgi:serine phosphatase RsbU (regulator of sigma subunit)
VVESDLVLAYTNGVIQAPNPAGEEWGVEGLLRAAAARDVESGEDMVQLIFKAMDEFSRGRQTDDTTVVVLQVH